jgi:hypothetical protein
LLEGTAFPDSIAILARANMVRKWIAYCRRKIFLDVRKAFLFALLLLNLPAAAATTKATAQKGALLRMGVHSDLRYHSQPSQSTFCAWLRNPDRSFCGFPVNLLWMSRVDIFI